MKQCLVVCGVLFFGLTLTAAGQDFHPWTHFEVGSWKQVRVVTESLDVQGNVESVNNNDTKTTLTQRESTSYTLKVEVTVEVAGRRFQSEPKAVKQGLHGESLGQPVEITAGGPARSSSRDDATRPRYSRCLSGGKAASASVPCTGRQLRRLTC